MTSTLQTNSGKKDFKTRDVQNSNFISVRIRFGFRKNLDSVQDEFGLVRFEKTRIWFGYFSYLLLM